MAKKKKKKKAKVAEVKQEVAKFPVEREMLLQQLQACEPGLSKKEQIAQSNCFVFKDGFVSTRWEEVHCRQKCEMAGLEGAVQATNLLAVLSKLTDEMITVWVEDGQMIIKGKGRRQCKLRMESEIHEHPAEGVDKWKKIDSKWDEACGVVKGSSTNDGQTFVLTCVHITPKFIEATDMVNVTRYDIKTNIKAKCLVRAPSLNAIVGVGMTHIGESDQWLHFKNQTGLQISIFRWIHEEQDYPTVDGAFDIDGSKKLQIPKGVVDCTDICEIFSSENGADDNYLMIELAKGEMTLSGEGMTGEYTETKSCDYKGPNVRFMMTPKLLRRVTTDMPDCSVTDKVLKVQGESFVHVSSLKPVTEPVSGKT